jgi:hypothetical protein
MAQAGQQLQLLRPLPELQRNRLELQRKLASLEALGCYGRQKTQQRAWCVVALALVDAELEDKWTTSAKQHCSARATLLLTPPVDVVAAIRNARAARAARAAVAALVAARMSCRNCQSQSRMRPHLPLLKRRRRPPRRLPIATPRFRPSMPRAGRLALRPMLA